VPKAITDRPDEGRRRSENALSEQQLKTGELGTDHGNHVEGTAGAAEARRNSAILLILRSRDLKSLSRLFIRPSDDDG
jgi:hypothetical protein